jgi:hypothetical protein
MFIIKFVILATIWFGFRYLYNFILIKKNVTTEKSPFYMSLVYAVFSIFLITLTNVYSIRVALLLVSLIALVITGSFIFKNIYFGRISNSTFQILWLYSVISVLNTGLIYSVLIFWVGHFPIYLLDHIKLPGKILLTLFSGIGGLLLVLVLQNTPLPWNIFIAVSIHFSFYILLRPLDSKYRLGIIN